MSTEADLIPGMLFYNGLRLFLLVKNDSGVWGEVFINEVEDDPNSPYVARFKMNGTDETQLSWIKLFNYEPVGYIDPEKLLCLLKTI